MATIDDPEGHEPQERRRNRTSSSQIPRSLRCLFSLCFPDDSDDDLVPYDHAAQSRPFQPPIEHEDSPLHQEALPLRASAVQLNETGSNTINQHPATNSQQECTPHGAGKTSSSSSHSANNAAAGPSSLIGHRDSAGDLTRQLPPRNSSGSADPLGLLRQASGSHKETDPTSTTRSGKPPTGTSGHRRVGSSGLDRASSAEALNEMDQPASLSSANVLNRIHQHGHHRRNTSKASHKGSSGGSMKELGLARSPSPRLLVPQEEEDDFCPTCLESYTEENPKIFTECGHHFHLPCLYEWANIKPTCPMCSLPMRW